MKILSHRGYWLASPEKNEGIAFRRSFDLCFGTETDVRDANGTLVISHDPAPADAMTLNGLLGLLGDRALPLALNIKADGLAELIKREMDGRRDWFVFDMSVPDMRSHLRASNPVFARLSEVEHETTWFSECAGVWLDGFQGEWYSLGIIEDLLRRDLKVCVVSPELHGRDRNGLWSLLHGLRHEPRLMLCTDHPEDAARHFNVAAHALADA
jgi:glycerophosphoryl diester phosphodiesterase